MYKAYRPRDPTIAYTPQFGHFPPCEGAGPKMGVQEVIAQKSSKVIVDFPQLKPAS